MASILTAISNDLPELERTFQIAKHATSEGFKWKGITDVLAKCKEELDEVTEAIEEQDPVHIEEEVGDLLLMAVTLAYYCNIHPEVALKKSNDKFIKRFGVMEDFVLKEKANFNEATLEEMIEGWLYAKKLERGESTC